MSDRGVDILKRSLLVLCALFAWVTLPSAQAATYSFRNDPFAGSYDAPSGTATSVTWHAGTDGQWLGSPACTSYPNGDDDWADVVFPSGFTFVFGGTTYSQVRIYTNGMLAFGTDVSGFHRDYTPQALPIAAAGTPGPQGNCSLSAIPVNLMIAYWNDIVAGSARGVTGDAVKYELLGTAPTRRFVITWSNVALYSATTTRYTFQIALFESASGVNGPFEYRYTSGASTGTGATVGVQLSTTDYTQYAYNQNFIDTTNGTNIHWYPQTTLASAAGVYHFDEASWNGTPGQVIDSSGIVPAPNGTSVGAANTVASTKCGSGRAGSFPANTANTVISAVDTTLIPGTTGSIDFWYYSNVNWNTANSQAMLFDASPSAVRPFYLMKTATGALQFTVSDSVGAISTTTSAAQNFAANTWQHIGVSWVFLKGTNQTYIQIFLNGVLVTSARYTTNGTIAALNTLYIGDNRTSGVTPSGGTPNSANGNIDEVEVYTSQINAYQATADLSCSALIDHLLIQSSATGLTCLSNPLTIFACHDAACAVKYTAGVTGILSATGTSMTVNWDGTTGGAAGSGFSMGSSGTVVKNVQVATTGTVTFGLSSPNPVPINGTVCSFGNNAPSNNNCVFTVSKAGFIFSNSITGGSYTIPPQVSGIATPTAPAANAVYLRALETSTSNPAVCTPALINSTASVTMGYTCNNPLTCTAGSYGAINGNMVAAAGTAVSLAFDANGSAPIAVRYDDVGQITLNASVTPFVGGTAMIGSSNAFVVVPHHFGFSNITAAPIKAGTNFLATVTAYNGLATSTATPNFGIETPAQGVTLTSTLVQPAGTGASAGALAPPTFTPYTGGMTTATTSWSEVGLITLTATNTNYLSSLLNATGTSANIGRFIPDHFETVVTHGCAAGSYTYSGQPFKVVITAKNGLTVPTTTVNYDGTANTSPNFAKVVTLSDGNALPIPVGTLSSGSSVAASAFAGGVGTTTTPVYTFNNQATARQNALTIIKLHAVDSDLVSSSSIEGTTEIRGGRVKLANAHGSELLDLPVAMQAQYWNGTSWVKNPNDTCTGDVTLGAANATAVTLTTLTTPAISTCVQDSGNPGLSGVGCVAAGPSSRRFKEGATPGIGFAGDFNLWLRAPGAAGAVTVGGSVPTWLQFNWFGAGVVNPAGRATFGVYKGANEFIYQREAY